jgi:hypothetical protein
MLRDEATMLMSKSEQKISVKTDHVLVERSPGYEVVMADQPTTLAEWSKVCETTGIKKVLVLGHDTKVHLSLMDIFELGQKLAKLGLQIAVVETHDASTSSVEFLESVATIRGGPLKFFGDERSAKDWLEIT